MDRETSCVQIRQHSLLAKARGYCDMNSSVIQLYMVSDSEAAPPRSLPVLPIEVSAFQLKMGSSESFHQREKLSFGKIDLANMLACSFSASFCLLFTTCK